MISYSDSLRRELSFKYQHAWSEISLLSRMTQVNNFPWHALGVMPRVCHAKLFTQPIIQALEKLKVFIATFIVENSSLTTNFPYSDLGETV